MTLIIEDGSIVPGANSYATVAEADTLLSLLGHPTWAGLTLEAKEADLAKGFYVVNDGATYVYDGARTGYGQEGAWPRTGATYGTTGPVIPSNAIPPEMRRAQIVAAGGIADGSIKLTGSDLLVKSESVDVLSVTYFSPKESIEAKVGPFTGVGWPGVTAIVAPLLDETAYPGDGVSATEAARRGPRFHAPSYHTIWDVGMNDWDRSGYGEGETNIPAGMARNRARSGGGPA
jgi:hypothetical protein